MPCEQFRKLIVEAALGALGGKALAEFEAHRVSCDACQTELLRVTELVDSIDRGVAEAVDVQPSAEFAAQLSRRLSESPAGQTFLPGSSFPIVAGGLAVVALFAFVFVPELSRLRDRNALRGSAKVSVNGAVSSSAAAANVRPPRTANGQASIGSVHASRSKGEPSNGRAPFVKPMPEVIVPPHEWLAVNRLAANVSGVSVNLAPIETAEVQSIELTEIASSELPMFNAIPVDERDALGDSQSR